MTRPRRFVRVTIAVAAAMLAATFAGAADTSRKDRERAERDARKAEMRAELDERRTEEVRMEAAALRAEADAIEANARFAAERKTRNENRKFADLNFGVGLAVSGDLGARERIGDAAVDANGIVRVNRKDNVKNRVMLESHYFFCKRECNQGAEPARVGWGPMMAIQPGEDEIIDAMAIGFMIGLRRGTSRPGQSFNVAVGAIVDPSVKVLGDEFDENRPAPLDGAGAPLPIRFQERDQWGWMVMFSFTWGEGDDKGE